MGERMQGKTALVTGATSNIGRAIAIAFAAEGANVVVSGRSASRGGEVVQEIRRAGGHAQFVAADLDGSARASRELSTAALDALGGRLDVLVNSAGIFPGSTTPTVDEAMFDEVYAVNVKAPFFLTAAINDRPRIGIDHQPRLLGGPIGNPRRRAVCINEGGDGDPDPAWAAEFGSPGVRVNAISPGVVRTGIENDPATAMMRGTPYGAFGTPDAIAHAAVHLRRIAVRQRHGHRR